MKKFLATICAATILLTGCGENSAANSATVTAEKISVTEAKTLDTIKISVNGQTFTATLEDNPTARAFAEKLPLELDMQELHGNEKYFYLNESLPSNAERVGKISVGDLMLFGDNCVVIFYKNFSTSYSYTRLGKINSADLEKILGSGNVHVTFER
ncbi:MAG: hypothetical protein IJ685_13875 [Selenomonadaceae bacterium]|nr:hypothetical protein [Selenomonadaceae bacterium]